MSGGRHHLHEEGGAPRAEVALFGFYFVMERFSVKRFLKSTDADLHRTPSTGINRLRGNSKLHRIFIEPKTSE
jgi:hypothetical protein